MNHRPLFWSLLTIAALAIAAVVASTTHAPLRSAMPNQARATHPQQPTIESVWPQWGGTSYRNNVATATGIPTDWDIGDLRRFERGLRPPRSRNIKWVVPLGVSGGWPALGGGPVVAGGKIFIGSNNRGGYVPRIPAQIDVGCLLCFRQRDGEFLWQYTIERLKTGRVNDWPMSSGTGAPYVEADRLWVVTNRCEVVCLDTEGFLDEENDGPFRDEVDVEADAADVVWKLDMIERLGVFPHTASTCWITGAGDTIFVSTSNGVDQSHINIPKPDAPSFLALDKNTGRILWTDNSPGANILHGQWSSPAYGILAGQPQVIFAGGDGWLYSFDPAGAPDGESKLLWKFDCNPKTSRWDLRAVRGERRNNIMAPPVIYQGHVYVATGQIAEHGEGPGDLWCLDPSLRGDVSPELVYNKRDPESPIAHKREQACVQEEGDFTRPNPNSAVVWHYDEFDADSDGDISRLEQVHRTYSAPAIANDLLILADFAGIVHCIDAITGKPYWAYDSQSAHWAAPLIVNDHVYVGDEDSVLTIFKLTSQKDGAESVSQMIMESSIATAPIVVNNTLYICTRPFLFAIETQP